MLKVEYVPITSLKPYENNAKLHPKEQIEQIIRSIQDYGMNDPIAVWQNEIVEGHGRYLALLKMGADEVPIIRLDELTDEQRREYMLVHNQTTLNSGMDLELLDFELENLPDFDAPFYNFDFSIGDEEQEIVEDEPPEPPAEPKAKLGDLYQLGEHRLICGDSTDIAVIDRLMDGVKADCVLSDPPYGMNLDTDFSAIKGSMNSIGRKNHTEGNKYERVIGDNDDFTPDLINTFFANFDYVKEMFLFGAD